MPTKATETAAASPMGHDQPNALGVYAVHQVVEIEIPRTVGRLAVLLAQGADGRWRTGFELDLHKGMGASSSPVTVNAKALDTPAAAARFRLVRMRDTFHERAKELPVKPSSVYRALDKASKHIEALIAAAPWRDATAIHGEG